MLRVRPIEPRLGRLTCIHVSAAQLVVFLGLVAISPIHLCSASTTFLLLMRYTTRLWHEDGQKQVLRARNRRTTIALNTGSTERGKKGLSFSRRIRRRLELRRYILTSSQGIPLRLNLVALARSGGPRLCRKKNGAHREFPEPTISAQCSLFHTVVLTMLPSTCNPAADPRK